MRYGDDDMACDDMACSNLNENQTCIISDSRLTGQYELAPYDNDNIHSNTTCASSVIDNIVLTKTQTPTAYASMDVEQLGSQQTRYVLESGKCARHSNFETYLGAYNLNITSVRGMHCDGDYYQISDSRYNQIYSRADPNMITHDDEATEGYRFAKADMDTSRSTSIDLSAFVGVDDNDFCVDTISPIGGYERGQHHMVDSIKKFANDDALHENDRDSSKLLVASIISTAICKIFDLLTTDTIMDVYNMATTHAMYQNQTYRIDSQISHARFSHSSANLLQFYCDCHMNILRLSCELSGSYVCYDKNIR